MAEDDDRVVELLEQLVTWIKAGLYGNVSALIEEQFEEVQPRPEQRLAYHLCEDHTYQEIIDVCRASLDDPRISSGALSSWVNSWENVGLISRRGRAVQKHFSLEDFGLDVPDFDLSVLEDD